MHGQLQPRRARVLAAVRKHRWLLDTFLLLVILGLLLDKKSSQKEKSHEFEGAGDITGFAPKFSQQITSFSPDALFMPENSSEFFSDEVRQKWLSIVPKGLGYLLVKNPEQYDNLPTPLEEQGDKFVVTTSMTHQLHCLYAIAEVYASLSSGKMTPTEMPWHLNHCFDYIRQGIMCAGDVAVEGKQTTFPEGFVGSDGWDAKHVCKDYNQVLDYLEKNAANDEVWI
ncbi:uncharacterized protein BCR38DRAFT_335865 [Pseudomassariella vexata]|uniref:Oxidase ustYa n=1 Tax=Pseudomassariella vexata TaxID=1141098 RepID=A0A1Y2EAA2_9PEZI|nr:uncharacterized protein BCR38DRAFT_335865 [Pseudomassariella vexata]ORY68520.1 hypothetical protein BCR38DRAFT_335865 [Pseudomassariella vexata]